MSDVIQKEMLEELELDGEYKLGQQIIMARQAYTVATKSNVTRAISKEILTKRGLISISDYYQKVAHI